MINIWFTIEKSSNGYTVWRNKEKNCGTHGSYGSNKVYGASTKKECIEYCKKNNIKVSKIK